MSKLFQTLKKSELQYLPNLYTLSVRWATKPRWVPPAKTKIFRVHQRPVIPEEERKELQNLNNVYRTRMKSLREFFKKLHQTNATSKEVLQKFEQEKEDYWEECMKINDEWNKTLAVERDERNVQRLEKEIEEALEEIKMKEQQEQKKLEQLNELIRKEKEASKNFITEKNIDEAIERVLSQPPHSFYFAIDSEGKIYPGLSDSSEGESENMEENQKVENVT